MNELAGAMVAAQALCLGAFILGLYVGLALMKFAYENN